MPLDQNIPHRSPIQCFRAFSPMLLRQNMLVAPSLVEVGACGGSFALQAPDSATESVQHAWCAYGPQGKARACNVDAWTGGREATYVAAAVGPFFTFLGAPSEAAPSTGTFQALVGSVEGHCSSEEELRAIKHVWADSKDADVMSKRQ